MLKVVARAINSSIRACDFGFRYGGEEFAIILPDTGRDGAMILAERIRHRAKRMSSFALKSLEENISLSGGIATHPKDAMSADELLRKADQALYWAKENGRDRIGCDYSN